MMDSILRYRTNVLSVGAKDGGAHVLDDARASAADNSSGR